MAFRIVHCNINVTDLERSIAFYEQALGLTVARKLEAEDGSFTLCYLQDATGSFQIELTWLKDHPHPMSWEKMKVISHLRVMILKQRISYMRIWDASALRIRRWESILSTIQMTTGWKSSRHNLTAYGKHLLAGVFLYAFPSGIFHCE